MKDTYSLSNSSLEGFMSCARAYNWGSLQGYKSAGSSHKMDRGTMVHHFLEKYYKLRMGSKQNTDLFLQASRYAQEKMLLEKLAVTDEEAKFVLDIMNDYCKVYEQDTWVPIQVEGKFSILLHDGDNYQILYEGRIDLMSQVPQSGNTVVVIDHKTTERVESTHSHNMQLMGYALATGKNIVVINEINLTKGCKSAERFKRYTKAYSKKQLAEFQQWLTYWAIRAVESERENHFPPSYSSCKYCRFENICSNEESAREFRLDLNFVKKPKFDLFAEKKDES